jgi:hypothetical protein
LRRSVDGRAIPRPDTRSVAGSPPATLLEKTRWPCSFCSSAGLSGAHMNRLDAYRLILTQKIDGTQQPGKKTIYADADPKKVALKSPKLRMVKLSPK